jgi:hypothetical protein
MKLKKFAVNGLLTASIYSSAMAQNQMLGVGNQILTGDVGLACEAILCLSSGTRPGECMPSLRKYFSIKKLLDRKNFLKGCPAVASDAGLQALVNDIANGAGQCDATSLNAGMMIGNETGSTRISNQLPVQCVSYFSNGYTDFKDVIPKYVGTPERKGFWVEAAQYDVALAQYKVGQAAEAALENSNAQSSN